MLYRKNKRSHFFLKLTAVLLAAAGILCVNIFESKVSDFCKGYIPNRARMLSTNAVCEAVEKELSSLELSYEELSKAFFTGDGRVSTLATNSSKINLIKSRVTKAAQDGLDSLEKCEARIPIGAFTGLTLLSNTGPEVSVNFTMTGSFNSRIESSFECAGINQTVHHIRLIMESYVVTASLDYTGEISFTSDFELAQSVLVGEIPSTYGGIYPAYR